MDSKNPGSEKKGVRIYRPGPNIKAKLQSLRFAIHDKPPFCSGTVPVVESELAIYFRKPVENQSSNFSASFFNFTNATESDLQELVDACQVATFGLKDKDVLDLSYRKAWKLDPEFFSMKLNVLHAGLMDSIRYNLLSADQGTKPFFAELYKLNVYGKGSFFKPHKDTPRGDKMFGSLVVVLPAPHEGGTLILRHDDKEWKIESDQVEASSIVYAAFYGDVEHEVTEVKSGFRVTLTYNLYFGKSLDPQSVVSTPSTASVDLLAALPPHAGSFQTKLAELLADDTFLPMGGRLGFGLFHEYCIDRASNTVDVPSRTGYEQATVTDDDSSKDSDDDSSKGSDDDSSKDSDNDLSKDYDDDSSKDSGQAARTDADSDGSGRAADIGAEKDELGRLADVLKGNDAVIMQACRALGLDCVLNVCYIDDDYAFIALCDKVPNLEGQLVYCMFVEYLSTEYRASVTADTHCRYINKEWESLEKIDLYDVGLYEDGRRHIEIDFFLHWITKMTPNNAFHAKTVVYGNEPQLLGAYGHVCLIINVGPPGRRSDKPVVV